MDRREFLGAAVVGAIGLPANNLLAASQPLTILRIQEIWRCGNSDASLIKYLLFDPAALEAARSDIAAGRFVARSVRCDPCVWVLSSYVTQPVAPTELFLVEDAQQRSQRLPVVIMNGLVSKYSTENMRQGLPVLLAGLPCRLTHESAESVFVRLVTGDSDTARYRIRGLCVAPERYRPLAGKRLSLIDAETLRDYSVSRLWSLNDVEPL